MPLWIMLSATLAFSGAVLAFLAWAFKAPWSAQYRINDNPRRRPSKAKLIRSAIQNSTISVVMSIGVTYGLYDHLFYDGLGSIWRMAFEVVAILGLYDFFYYLMHRFLFHEWSVLRGVHAVHHVTKQPTALDALYIHPLETAMGLGLLLACTWLVGPVSPYAFIVTFVVYSVLNIVIHDGLDVRVFGLRALSYLARKHDKHHGGMQRGNYASITPLWDIVFRTAE